MKSDIEMQKCETMRKAAYSRDIRPAFMCIQSPDCILSVRNNESDATIVGISHQQFARESQLIPVAHETTDNHYYIVVEKNLKDDQLYKVPMYVKR